MSPHLMDDKSMDAQDATAYQLMVEYSAETAERMLARLQSLYRQYPSSELAEAVREMEEWRDRLRESQP